MHLRVDMHPEFTHMLRGWPPKAVKLVGSGPLPSDDLNNELRCFPWVVSRDAEE